MKLIILVFVFIFCFQSLFSQDNIVVNTNESERGTLFTVENTTKKTYKVSLTIESNAIKKGKKIIRKKVNAYREKTFYFLKHEEPITYSTSIDVVAKKREHKKSKYHKTFNNKKDDVNDGIIIFSKNTCERCRITENYLVKHKIKFKNISTSNTNYGKKLMWKLLSEHSNQIQHVTMPVILIDGKLSYSHHDLMRFLTTINKK